MASSDSASDMLLGGTWFESNPVSGDSCMMNRERISKLNILMWRQTVDITFPLYLMAKSVPKQRKPWTSK
jgi:hypothetical protein